jgi:hypothetical protein
MTLIAYHGDPAIKSKYLNRVLAHQAADEIAHGFYWENGKGCAVGCTLHSNRHAAYETELGVPRMLARLEDRLFEGMANGKSKEFPAKFLAAIQPGADLSRVGWIFLHWLLTEELVGRDDPRVAQQVKACADVLIPLTQGEPVDRQAAHEARGEAFRVRDAARAADAAYAAYAAAADAAADATTAAYYADYDAADATAADAAYAAAAAAAAAATADYAAADAAYAAATAATAARSKAYGCMADKLLQLLIEAPMAERPSVAA